ncbi:hypothetical protein Hsw_3321 [Hymenobacter swuensis DY53]|uniref:Uncharacterized protein n=2 Tax=Hymenobacter TaxID=89966 RepID=W8F8J9_9BACT|nr:hypothetical protein Hsw_3321 [Hymenobacter swuensis DY53]
MFDDYESDEEEAEDGMSQGLRVLAIFCILAAIIYPIAEWAAGRWLETHP